MARRISSEKSDAAFAGLIRQLPENCVEYMLFIVDKPASDSPQTRLELEIVRKDAVQLSQALLKDYLWQRDDFQLEFKNLDGLLLLHGITDFGDAIEDEWLIVYLIRELTKSHLNLCARVSDSDGEFLLVEAAGALPKWLSPENDQHRAWIRQGHLCIIPPSNSNKTSGPDCKSATLPLAKAVDFLSTTPNLLVLSSVIENEAFYRLRDYPKQIKESMHRSLVTIPRKLAHIVHLLPKSVAPAIEAFYLRDSVRLEPILRASSTLQLPPNDLVTLSVRFSKVLFAQLKSQRFEPPPRWKELFNGSSTPSVLLNNRKNIDRLETGMKLTCGFEMLANEARRHKRMVVRELATMLDDAYQDGESSLPSDEVIHTWNQSSSDDDESWLDISYCDLEREFGGRQTGDSKQERSGVGDTHMQETLRRIVSRFEKFLGDEHAGIYGAELDDMDNDDGDEGEGESTGECTNEKGKDEREGNSGTYEKCENDVHFDESTFSQLVKEVMGIRTTDSQLEGNGGHNCPSQMPPDSEVFNVGNDGEDEELYVQQLTSQMEAELNENNAFGLIPSASNRNNNLQSRRPNRLQPSEATDRSRVDTRDDDDDEIQIDYNLAKNLLESFKSQGGAAGPVGNLIGLMGYLLPRDEDQASDA